MDSRVSGLQNKFMHVSETAFYRVEEYFADAFEEVQHI